MSTAASERPDGPLIPQPANNPEDLRAAIAQIMPKALAKFDADRSAALQEARRTGNAGPMRQLVSLWAVHVAIERFPDRAARLRELEDIAESTESLDEARAAAAEIGRILDQASDDAGISHGSAAR
ncbi:hypothetical protein B7P34_29450 [Streptosporangium nondiastaticum]|uniref:Uncharacterized protein n=2 Tax=Actinomycetes TaxID=1760 RepID=A0A9X7JK20_9ACTN|nr:MULTISPECIES: DUF6247 family protein [Actinomycetes]PSJ25189.1 hypothetical protein B7P34_29450 [Streptosporangium nondiastaticum]WKU45396.1 DUF6247 family protein [Streptomyces sp. VNUA116]